MSGLFPFISVPESFENVNNTLPLYTEVAWDFTNNKPILENGDFKIVEENEAIKVWIFKTLQVPRYQYDIYSWDYGSEVKELVGRAFTPSYTKEECKRYIKEALEVNPYIKSVDVYEVSYNKRKLHAKIKIETIYGETEVDTNV